MTPAPLPSQGWLSPVSVTIDRMQASYMAEVIAAVESVVGLPGYRDAVMAWAPAWARRAPGPLGVLLGYDFHLGPDGPRLIEVNTNAGGILMLDAAPTDELLAMFLAEWRRAGHTDEPAAIAIIDENPAGQFLYPEFLQFRDLFRQHGLEAHIGAPEELEYSGGRLRLRGNPIDLVYNRLTDFTLEQAGHRALREAYLAGDVVLTPHPHAHALYADKRNLILLSDAGRLRACGVPPATAALLAQAVPCTVLVSPENRSALWRERRHWFFKPARGYGSKGAFHGERLTLRVWGEICGGDYVAQRVVPPSRVNGPSGELKLDLRHYVYAGNILRRVARLYRGQATNLRTPGGGFAEVGVRDFTQQTG